jgi:cobalt/nickel transport system permease protein
MPFDSAAGVAMATSTGRSPLQRLDARLKLLAAVGCVILVVLTPIGWWRMLGLEAFSIAFLAGLAGLTPGEFARRWLTFFVLVGFLTLLVAVNHPARTDFGLAVVALTILAKNSLAFLIMVVLGAVTPFHRLLGAMRRLGVPVVLVSTLQFLYRYQFVLREEVGRMLTARRARSFGRRGLPSWSQLTSLIAMLFLRTLERGERVHSAMVARGWDGTIHSLDD